MTVKEYTSDFDAIKVRRAGKDKWELLDKLMSDSTSGPPESSAPIVVAEKLSKKEAMDARAKTNKQYGFPNHAARGDWYRGVIQLTDNHSY